MRCGPRSASQQGGLAAAAAFLDRSVLLTANPARRADRMLAAAQASMQAGAFGKALELLAAAEGEPLDEFQHARVDLLRAHVTFASGLGSDAPPLLLKAARRLEPFDLELARETYLTAWRAAGMAGHLAGPGVLVEICRAAQALPPPPGTPRPLDLLLDGLALLTTDGRASALIASVIEEAAAEGQGLAAAWAHWAGAVLYNGLARYEEAAAAARHATSDTFNPWMSMWALPELVEAAARMGDAELARDALARLAETTQPCGTDPALGIEARCRALLSDGASAGDLYREAIDRLSRTELRPELARAHLLYGEWLRRARRRTDARAQLRTAHDMLDAMGMAAFVERAWRELRVSGEVVRRRTVGTVTMLTVQEACIAQLARDGRTNPEIGAQLFLSARTVEWHLRKIFTKLGIGSRRELQVALAQLGQDGQDGQSA